MSVVLIVVLFALTGAASTSKRYNYCAITGGCFEVCISCFLSPSVPTAAGRGTGPTGTGPAGTARRAVLSTGFFPAPAGARGPQSPSPPGAQRCGGGSCSAAGSPCPGPGQAGPRRPQVLTAAPGAAAVVRPPRPAPGRSSGRSSFNRHRPLTAQSPPAMGERQGRAVLQEAAGPERVRPGPGPPARPGVLSRACGVCGRRQRSPDCGRGSGLAGTCPAGPCPSRRLRPGVAASGSAGSAGEPVAGAASPPGQARPGQRGRARGGPGRGGFTPTGLGIYWQGSVPALWAALERAQGRPGVLVPLGRVEPLGSVTAGSTARAV